MAQDSGNAPDRRGFFKRAAAAVISALVMIPAVGSGLRMFLDPLRKRGDGVSSVFVASLAALPSDGRPRRFQVIATRTDAWNKVTEPIGSVFLRRTQEGKVQALNASCPHAGCSVDFASTGGGYSCPCHDSVFGLDGAIASEASPSPRGMDELEVELRNGSDIWVHFQNFRAGEPEKIPLA